MAVRKTIEAKAEQLAIPVIEEKGFQFVDAEYIKEGEDYYLRIYADKEGGITIDDLESVSRIISDKLDEDDFINDQYILEVSSPGLGREIKKDRDYERNIDKPVEVHLYKAIEKEKVFVGTLVKYDDSVITLNIDDKQLEIEKKNISQIKEYFEF